MSLEATYELEWTISLIHDGDLDEEAVLDSHGKLMNTIVCGLPDIVKSDEYCKVYCTNLPSYYITSLPNYKFLVVSRPCVALGTCLAA